ncbi:MAG TPA: hypothetical protein VLC46_26060 [Thermoanaerobaculia bacterium]|jgi:predicted amidohydrolase|nr:hypothetical protein [Thermoanaerobaculia bacterium]
MPKQRENGIRRRNATVPPGHNPFFTLAKKLCIPDVIPEVAKLRRPVDGAVRLALISMPDVSYVEKDFKWRKALPSGVHEEDVRRTLAAVSHADSKRMLVAFREALLFAVEEGNANIVCVSELGLPSRDAVPLQEAQQIAFEISCKHNALIIAGSSHDSRTMFNTGYLFHPTEKRATWAFHKNASAHKMGERIMTPARRRVLIVDAFDLRIATMICLDVVDYTTLASVMAAGDQVDVVLVPSYTLRFEKMQDVATVASQALPGVVALVNARLPVGSSFIAQCGVEIKLPAPSVLPGGAEVALLSLKIDELKEKRTQAKNDLHPYLDWMFGNRYIPRDLQGPRRF